MKKSIFLEKPIESKEQDLFNISSYVEQLQDAINEGAKFIAIDGEHGSGKSSIINILENSEKNERNNATFVNINFLNIGNENKIENYHRYFVNQVANDICDDPFEIEKIFYHNHISYSVTNPSKNRVWRIIVDKILLLLTSFMVVYLTYATFLKSVEIFQFIFTYSDIYVPVILLTMFTLVVIYGYGIYKPEKQEQSPMLETDKCRINFCKIVSTKLKRNMIFNRKEKTKLFLIIDDLDRIDKDLQVKIISLLYNEYYPLKLKHAELYFIFMLDTTEIKIALEKIDLENEKLFDYIMSVSNNQKHIIRHLTNNMINDNDILNEIFNNDKIKNREYIINLICKYYTTIRKIKHFFNKLIAKYNYLKIKEVENVNYDELIIITLLLDMVKTSTLDIAISSTINNEDLEKTLDDNAKNILKDSKKKNIFDIDYYVYLYNFIDINDMLNNTESELYSISEKGYTETTDEEDKKILDYLENDKVRFDKIYHEIFLYLDNDTKMIFATSKKFCDYISKVSTITNDIDIKNAYKNNYGYYLCDNLKLNNINKNEVIFDLKQSYDTYISQRTTPTAQILNDNFVEFLENMNSRIIHFALKDYFLAIPINDRIYEALFMDVMYNNYEIGFELLNKDIIDCNYIKNYIDIPFIDKVNTLEEKLSLSIKTKILNDNNTSFGVLMKIICEENNKYKDIEVIYDKINAKASFIDLDKLVIILKKFGYNSKLDKHINQCLDTNSSKMVENINKNKYDLSMEVMNKLNSITTAYSFSEYYEKMFLENELYSLYIYSRIQNQHGLDYNQKLKDNDDYKKALLDNYKTINPWASQYDFTKRYTRLIFDNFDFNQIEFSNDNFWKITHLINHANGINDFENILSVLNSKDKLEDFFDYCIKKGRTIDINFIKFLRSYAEEQGMSSKVKTRLTRNINKITKVKSKTL